MTIYFIYKTIFRLTYLTSSNEMKEIIFISYDLVIVIGKLKCILQARLGNKLTF